jgi:hypothetical protein
MPAQERRRGWTLLLGCLGILVLLFLVIVAAALGGGGGGGGQQAQDAGGQRQQGQQSYPCSVARVSDSGRSGPRRSSFL